MNNTIETNQSYQKFKEILTARRIIGQWLNTASVFSNLFQVSRHQVCWQVLLCQPSGNNTLCNAFNSIGILIAWQYMNNTIETNLIWFETK